jgi:transposase, IS30 family
MGQIYNHLSGDERNFIHRHLNEGQSCRWIAGRLGRSGPTISREIKRSSGTAQGYDASSAASSCRARRRRGLVKLREGTMLRQYVLKHLRLAWSPQQISGKLKAMNCCALNGVDADVGTTGPALPVVSHETIYRAIYVIPRGDLRKDLIGFLRQAHKTRGARGRGVNRQGRLPDMVSIHERPEDALNRLIPGDWEGDFVKGAGNASAIGTLVERKSRYTLIAKMKDCGAQAALDGFTKAFAKVPKMMRRSLAYDQGKEMARHKELTSRLGMPVYFCDPHSPWQRPSNENLNGLVRQYLPKGIDLSIYSQTDLDRIAHSLNTRPRAVLGFQTPEEVFMAELSKLGDALQI